MRARLAITFVAILVWLSFAEVADAQRRRRRQQPRPQPTEQIEQAPDAGASSEGEAEAEAPGEEAVEGDAVEGDGDAPPAGTTEEGEAAEEANSSEPAVDGGAEAAYDDFSPLGPDLGPLREEYTAIMDELVQVRSQVAVLGRQLFQTRVRVHVQNRAGDDNSLARIVVSLDGAPVFQAEGGELQAEDGRQVFDGFAAPGPHVLTVEVEQRQRADDDYRYTIRDSFRFEIPRGKLTEATIVLEDDSDMGEDFEEDGEAEYDVTTRVRVATRELADR